MGRSRAVRGITPAKYFSPFYDTGRRFLGCSPETLDRLIAADVTAEMRAGNLLVFTDPAGRLMHQASYRFWHRGKVTRWAGKFNGKTMQARMQPR